MWECYIKPTTRAHESGFRCFEIGYGVFNGGKIVKKVILSNYSDVVHLYDLFIRGAAFGSERFCPRLDLMAGGYIRLLPSANPFHWIALASSDAMLEAGTIDQDECEKLWGRGQKKGRHEN